MIALDASITIARVHPKQNTPLILSVFDQVENGGAWVPPLWKIETANVLQAQVRRRIYGPLERDRYLRFVRSLNVHIDSTSPEFLWSTTIDLAHRHSLSVYDAVYLELALRRNLPLATLDLRLRTAATAEGVPLLGL